MLSVVSSPPSSAAAQDRKAICNLQLTMDHGLRTSWNIRVSVIVLVWRKLAAFSDYVEKRKRAASTATLAPAATPNNDSSAVILHCLSAAGDISSLFRVKRRRMQKTPSNDQVAEGSFFR